LIPVTVDAISGTIGGEYVLQPPRPDKDYVACDSYNPGATGKSAYGGFYIVGFYNGTSIDVYRILSNGSEILNYSKTINAGEALDFFDPGYEMYFWHIVSTKPIYTVAATPEGTNVQLTGPSGSNKDYVFYNHITSACWLTCGGSNGCNGGEFGGTFVYALEDNTTVNFTYLNQDGSPTTTKYNYTLNAGEYIAVNISKGQTPAFNGIPAGYSRIQGTGDALTVKIESNKKIMAGRFATDNDQQHFMSSFDGTWSGSEFGMYMDWNWGVGAFVSNPTNETVVVQAWNCTNSTNCTQIGGPVTVGDSAYPGKIGYGCPECNATCSVPPLSSKRCMFTVFCDVSQFSNNQPLYNCTGINPYTSYMFVKFNTTNSSDVVYMTAGGLRAPLWNAFLEDPAHWPVNPDWVIPPTRQADHMIKAPAANNQDIKYTYYRPYGSYGLTFYREDCNQDEAVLNLTPSVNLPVNLSYIYNVDSSWTRGGDGSVHGQSGLYVNGRNVITLLYSNASNTTFNVMYEPLCSQSGGSEGFDHYCNYNVIDVYGCNITPVGFGTYTYEGRNWNYTTFIVSNSSCEFGINSSGRIRITTPNNTMFWNRTMIGYSGFVEYALPGAQGPSVGDYQQDCTPGKNNSAGCESYASQWLLNITSSPSHAILVYPTAHTGNDEMTIYESLGPYTIFSSRANPELLKNKGEKINVSVNISNYGTKPAENLTVTHIIPGELYLLNDTLKFILINSSGDKIYLNYTLNYTNYTLSCTPVAFERDNLSKNGTVCVYVNSSTHETTLTFMLDVLKDVTSATTVGEYGDTIELEYTARLEEINPTGKIGIRTYYKYLYCSPFMAGNYGNETRIPTDIIISVPQLDVLKVVYPPFVEVGNYTTTEISFYDPFLRLINITVVDVVYVNNSNYSDDAYINQYNGSILINNRQINATNYSTLNSSGQNITFSYTTISELANISPNISTTITFKSQAVYSSINYTCDCAFITGYAMDEHNNIVPVNAQVCYSPPPSNTTITKEMNVTTMQAGDTALVTINFSTNQSFIWEGVDIGDILPISLNYSNNAMFYNGSALINISDCNTLPCYSGGTKITGPHFTTTLKGKTKVYWSFFDVGNVTWQINLTVKAISVSNVSNISLYSEPNYGFYSASFNASTRTEFALFLPPITVYYPSAGLFKFGPLKMLPNSTSTFVIRFWEQTGHADIHNIIINDTMYSNLTYNSSYIQIGGNRIDLINGTNANITILSNNMTQIYTNYTLISELKKLNKGGELYLFVVAISKLNASVNATYENESACELYGVRNNVTVLWSMGDGTAMKNNASSCPLTESPFMNITKTHEPNITEFYPGDKVNFIINITSTSYNVSGLSISDFLPSNLKYINANFTLYNSNGSVNKTFNLDPDISGGECADATILKWGSSNLTQNLNFTDHANNTYVLPENSTLILNLTAMFVLCKNKKLLENLSNSVIVSGDLLYVTIDNTTNITNTEHSAWIELAVDPVSLTLKPPILTCGFSIIQKQPENNTVYELELTMTESNKVPLYNITHKYRLEPGLNVTSMYVKIYNDSYLDTIPLNSSCLDFSGNPSTGINISFNYSKANDSNCAPLKTLLLINGSTVGSVIIEVTVIDNSSGVNASANGYAYSKDGTLLSCNDNWMWWYCPECANLIATKNAEVGCIEPGNYVNYTINYTFTTNNTNDTGVLFIKDKYAVGFVYNQTLNITINGSQQSNPKEYLNDENGRVLVWKFTNVGNNTNILIVYRMYENSTANDTSENQLNIQVGTAIYSKVYVNDLTICKPYLNATKTGPASAAQEA